MSRPIPRRAFLTAALGLSALAASACGAVPTLPPPPAVTDLPETPAATRQAAATAASDPTLEGERPEAVWQQYASLWARGDYAAMYEMLTADARQQTSAEEFAAYHENLAEATGLRQLTITATSSLVQGVGAQLGFHKLMDSERFGSIEETQTAYLVLDDGRWYLAWHPSLVLLGMDYGCTLALDASDNQRGAIYDRNGKPLASLGTRVIVGVVPGEIENEEGLLSALSNILDMDRDDIKSAYAEAARPDWFMPIGELSAQEAQDHYPVLSALPGILMRERSTRAYPEGAVVAHLTGYVGPITADQYADLQELGYREDDVVGQVGLEQSYEVELAGKRGSRLVIVGPNGEVRGIAAEKPSVPSQALYSTIDLDLQRLAASLLTGRRGAIVALDPRNGQVLTMASSPTFDPNAIVTGMSNEDWAKLLDDEGRPLVNRATQSELPPGSVFKIVTETAALESGLMETDSTFYCSGTWDGLGSAYIKRCWLPSGHGTLTLEQGLTASCDVVFYELGLALQNADRETLPHYAGLFGFGVRSGIGAVPESPGLVPNPTWKEATVGESWFPGDSVNLAIGQGHLLVTPLQIVDMLASVANGGTMYRPNLVLSLGQPPSASTPSPEKMGELPISQEHLASIQQSLLDGCMTPAGTAYSALGSMTVNVAGKTGTAENPGEAPHAWFAGYAPAEAPTIAVVVMLEYGGQGSLEAAPLFRQVVEAYLQPAGE